MKLTHIEDYYEKVHERFPDLEMWEIEKILNHGMRSFATLNSYGADILINSPANQFVMYFGKLFSNKEISNKYGALKARIKCRIKYWSQKPIWDGYYYFGLTEEEYQKYIPKKKGRKKVTFPTLKAFKIKEESMLLRKYKYFFRLSGEEDEGMVFNRENYSTRNISLIAKRNAEGKIIYNE